MKVLINKNSLRVGCFPLRKICIIEICIKENDKQYQGYIPYYQSSGFNENKVQGKWYPILGVYYHGEKVKKCIEYFVKLSCGSKYKTLENGWLMKSPFFVQFDGFVKDENKVPNGFGNHNFTDTLEKISNVISELYTNGDFIVDNDLQFSINKIMNNQKDIDFLIQYMVLGKLINEDID